MAESRRIRLGVIGTGLAIERLHWPALSKLRDRYEVVAFANHTRPKAEAFAARAGLSMEHYHADYRDLLARAEVEAVLIALPIPLNLPVARASLEAGKHVLCEKPTGADAAEARAFLELPGRFPRQVLLIGENFFYRDDLRLARALLDEGAIGQIHALVWRMVSQMTPRPGEYSGTVWRQRATYRGGPHLDGGVHHMAELRLLGGEIRQVQALLGALNPTMAGAADLTMALEFVSGAIGSYTALYPTVPTPDEPNVLRLYGTGGVMSVGRLEVMVARADGVVQVHRAAETDGGYYNQFLNFHDAIVHGEPVIGTVAQSVDAAMIVFSALDAAARGQPVAVPSLTHGVPLWRPRGATGLFDGLPVRIGTDER